MLDFSIVDVFTQKPFSGNPVAVIHDAAGLNSLQMQTIAREFGYSESTFLLPPADTCFTATVRIFTPFAEVPFAGHPNIGAALVIATEETAALNGTAAKLRFDERAGPVLVRPLCEGGAVVGASVEAPQNLHILDSVPVEMIADCFGIPLSGVRTSCVETCVASVGLPFAFVEIADRSTLAKLEPDIGAFRQARDRGPKTVDGFAVCAFVGAGCEGG